MEIIEPSHVEKRSGKDRRSSFLNGLDRRQSAGQVEDGAQADSVAFLETARAEQFALSQSETGFD